MTQCPWCNEKALTQFRKAFLGPALSTRCQNCGKSISVSWLTLFMAFPGTIGVLAGGYLAVNDQSAAAAIVFTLMFAASFSFHAFLVPLTRRGA